VEKVYFEDLSAGQRFVGTATLTVTEEAVKDFAAKYDPQPFHLSDEGAKGTLFGELAASGWHTAAMTMKLLVADMRLAGGIIGGGGEIAWPQPTRPGDVLHVESEIVDVIPSKSRPERGMAVMRTETKNQKGETMQSITMKLVVPRRSA